MLIRRSTSIISSCIVLCNGDHDFGKHHLFHLWKDGMIFTPGSSNFCEAVLKQSQTIPKLGWNLKLKGMYFTHTHTQLGRKLLNVFQMLFMFRENKSSSCRKDCYAIKIN
jgi:hypothetical protein